MKTAGRLLRNFNVTIGKGSVDGEPTLRRSVTGIAAINRFGTAFNYSF